MIQQKRRKLYGYPSEIWWEKPIMWRLFVTLVVCSVLKVETLCYVMYQLYYWSKLRRAHKIMFAKEKLTSKVCNSVMPYIIMYNNNTHIMKIKVALRKSWGGVAWHLSTLNCDVCGGAAFVHPWFGMCGVCNICGCNKPHFPKSPLSRLPIHHWMLSFIKWFWWSYKKFWKHCWNLLMLLYLVTFSIQNWSMRDSGWN